MFDLKKRHDGNSLDSYKNSLFNSYVIDIFSFYYCINIINIYNNRCIRRMQTCKIEIFSDKYCLAANQRNGCSIRSGKVQGYLLYM